MPLHQDSSQWSNEAAAAIPPAEMTLDELRDTFGDILPAHAAFDGWSTAALQSAAQQLGIPEERAGLVFPGGATDMIDAWIESADRRMIAEMESRGVTTMKVRERIRTAIWVRLQQAAPHREAVRRAVAVLAMPQNAAMAARTLWRTSDAIWRAAGDVSSDFSHYSRRMTLGGVYSATLLFWLNDDSEDMAESAAFLDRRIEDVMRIERTKAQWRAGSQRRPSLLRLLGRLRYPTV